MVLFGLILVVFSIVLIASSNRAARQADVCEYVWRRCSAQSIGLAHLAQTVFDKTSIETVTVCYSPETEVFTICQEPGCNDWSIELNRRNSFEENCLIAERFVANARKLNKE